MFGIALLLPHINSAMQQPITPQNHLIDAIKRSNLKGVKQAIKDKASVNSPTEDGFTPLIIAVTQKAVIKEPKGDAVKIVTFLMEKEADINAATAQGRTALMVAAKQGYTPYVQELLKNKKLNVDKQDKKGTTALMFAVLNGHLDIVKLLVKKGAHITLRDNAEKTAFDYAEDKEIKKYLEPLVDEQNIKKQGIWARLTGTASKKVLDDKPKAIVFVWARDNSGKPQVGAFDLKELQRRIKNYRGDKEELINFPGPYGYTALHYAVVNGDVLLAELLFENGADPLVPDANRQTPLYQVLYHATKTNKEKTEALFKLFEKALKESYEKELKKAYALLPKSKKNIKYLQQLPIAEATILVEPL